MSETYNFISWNVCNGLSGGESNSRLKDQTPQQRMQAVVDRTKSIGATSILMAEGFNEAAYVGGSPAEREELCETPLDAEKAELLAAAEEQLVAEGFHFHHVLYRDADGRRDRHGFVLLSRLDPKKNPVEVFQLGSRRVLGQYVRDLDLWNVGVHFNDRSSGPAQDRRLTQAEGLLTHPQTPRGIVLANSRTLLEGDYNETRVNNGLTRALSAVRYLHPIMARLASDPGEETWDVLKIRRGFSLGDRASMMTETQTLDYIEGLGFRDLIDGPTKGGMQLDHAYTNIPADDKDLHFEGQILPTTPAESDHRAAAVRRVTVEV